MLWNCCWTSIVLFRQHWRSKQSSALLSLLLCGLVSISGRADPAPEDDSAEQAARDKTFEFLRTYTARHRIATASAPDEPLVLGEQPLMSWTNPRRTPSHVGGIFLWTRNGRPMAFCGVYALEVEGEPAVSREFHSLSEEALVAHLDEERIWAPTGPGIEFKAVPESGRPAETAALRLRQIKAIASKCSIRINRVGATEETLRVFPRPIYRYADSDAGLIDGAIVAYVQGTDPEAFLLIEARADDNGGQWQCAVARSTSWKVTAQMGGRTIYEVPQYYGSGPHGVDSPFLCFHQMPVK